MVLAVIRDALKSSRWSDPYAPGSAHLKELHEYVADPAVYADFRETESGSYALSIVEPLQDALNDDWLPETLLGLPLNKTKTFLLAAAEEIERSGLSAAIQRLRAIHTELSNEA